MSRAADGLGCRWTRTTTDVRQYSQEQLLHALGLLGESRVPDTRTEVRLDNGILMVTIKTTEKLGEAP